MTISKTRTSRIVLNSIVVLIGTTILILLPRTSRSSESKAAQIDIGYNNDFVCGPRCARYVLEHYGKTDGADLTALVKKMQLPNLEQGVSLASLGRCLSEHGIYASAVNVPPDRIGYLPSGHPIIAFVKPDEGQSRVLGHFVVLNRIQDQIQVWDGIYGLRDPDGNFLRHLSGDVLLTSDHLIDVQRLDEEFRHSYSYVYEAILKNGPWFSLLFLVGVNYQIICSYKKE